MLEGIQNTYTLPTLGLLMALSGFVAVALQREPNRAPVLGAVGCLLLFASLHRYGSGPGSGSPALQLLLLLSVLCPTTLALLNRRPSDGRFLVWSGVTLATVHLPLLPLPWPSWVVLQVRDNLPLCYLMSTIHFAMIASDSGPRLLAQRVAGINLLLFSWLLYFGIGTMGGLPAQARTFPFVAAAIAGMGLGCLWNGPDPAHRAVRVARILPPALLTLRLAAKSEGLPALLVSAGLTLLGLSFRKEGERRA